MILEKQIRFAVHIDTNHRSAYILTFYALFIFVGLFITVIIITKEKVNENPFNTEYG